MIETMKRTRPRVVDVAFWLWAVGAILLILLGLITVTTSSDGLREQLAGTDGVDTEILLVRALGGLSLAVGLAVGLVVHGVREGRPRSRFVAVLLSAVYSVVQMLLVLVGLHTVFAMTLPLMLLVASVLVFRPEGHGWFVR
ncbi:hypothetical protein [Rhodococcus sp. NPDC058521]|uniref:hypothetical protein n=1 Tax=Rhodococcus sp. NPDC058521 TaxID=3346536 RepID=UPI0036652ACD